MRKYLVVLFCFSAISFLSACEAADQSASVVDVVLKQEDHGKVLTLNKGDTLSIELPAQLGTGFSWVVKKYPEAALKFVGMKNVDKKREAGQEAGAVSTQVFLFKAIGQDSGPITLWYCRPFDEKNPPEKIFRVRVVVD